MERPAASLLNERQKQCLRLVYENLEAKEIAQRLGLSPHTVNEHLRDARRALGVGRSMQAARLLADAERYNRLVPDAVGVGREAPIEEVASTSTVERPAVAIGANRYDLSLLQRLGLIVAIAVGVVALGGALLTAVDAITRTLRDNRIDISSGVYRSK